MISLSAAAMLARTCAPAVAPTTMLSLISAESGFDPFAIGDNDARRRLRPRDRAEAQARAAALIAAGHSVDMGLAQINSRVAPRLGLSVADAFDPCRNLAAAARLMTTNYRQAARIAPSHQHALGMMLSAYNTGDLRRGFRNGYVARVYRAATRIASLSPRATVRAPYPDALAPVPVSVAQSLPSSRVQQENVAGVGRPAAISSLRSLPPWTVFGAPSATTLVFDQPLPKGPTP